MKTTLDYIEDAKNALGIESDYGLAQWLNVTKQAVSNYTRGKATIDDYAAIKIAEALGVPPLQIIATANAERERDDKRKGFWENVARSATMGLIALAVSGPVPQEVRAESLSIQQLIYYAQWRKSRRWSAAA